MAICPKTLLGFFGSTEICPCCGDKVQTINITDNTVIREFSQNYWLKKDKCGHYDSEGRYAVLCKYSDFINNPQKYIDSAYNKTNQPIAKYVHFRDIEHKGM